MYRTYQTPVRFVESADHLVLRELNTEDEQSIVGIATRDAVQLIQRLVVDTEATKQKASRLISMDRDMLLAAIYTHTFGSRIQGTMTCPDCEEPYDYDFDLEEIRNQLLSGFEEPAVHFRGDDVLFRFNDNELRLLNGEDEINLENADTTEANRILLERTCPNYSSENEIDVEQLLSEVAPIMSIDMESVCPECESRHNIEFDMQYYLMTKLRQEQRFLWYEIHRLAAAYRWSQAEILSLPRRIRKLHVNYIENDLERGLV